MGKNLQFSVLLDIYGDVLTEKQRDVMELYYNEDLSLGEIAEHENISRQGVRDSIKRGEEAILELDKALGLAAKLERFSDMIAEIKEKAQLIYEESSTYKYSNIITNNAKEILNCIESNDDII